MKRCFMTCCSADWYQNFIPIYIWSILKTWKDVDIHIYLRGGLTDKISSLVDTIIQSEQQKVYITQFYKTEYPYLVSTTNSLRFVTKPIKNYDEVLITDIDFFFSEMPQDLFLWHRMHKDSLMPNNCYSGTHGPLVRPPRPHICPSWEGDFQRIAGGFVVLYPEWWDTTFDQRQLWDEKLKKGEWGHFREADEVLLYRIIRDSGLPIAPKVPFPRFLRHLHIGDFRPNMKIRYDNKQKMRGFLDERAVNSFLSALNNKVFSNILNIVRENSTINDVLGRCIDYCNKRKRKEV